MSSEEKVRAHVIVHGRVQGVYFRYETQKSALQSGVVGWVRNLPDGTVEAVLEGPKANVDTTLNWCRKGPPAARVDQLDVAWLPAEGDYHRFEIRY